MRRARVADLSDLRRLWQQLDSEHAAIAPTFFERGERSVSPETLRQVLGDHDRCLLVAVLAEGEGSVELHADHVEGRVIGVVDVRVYDTPGDQMLVQRRRAHVDEIVVDADQQRHGVGRALMVEATAWCRRRGACQVLLSVWAGNRSAERFYNELGYVEVNRVLGRELS